MVHQNVITSDMGNICPSDILSLFLQVLFNIWTSTVTVAAIYLF
jgi:hypothetical protein